MASVAAGADRVSERADRVVFAHAGAPAADDDMAAGRHVARRNRPHAPEPEVARACTAYFVVFALALLVLLRFCFIERSPYIYFAFPASFLTAACLDRMKAVLLRAALVALSAATAIYVYVGFAVPGVTSASRA